MLVRLHVPGSLNLATFAELPPPIIAPGNGEARFHLGGNLGVLRLSELYRAFDWGETDDVFIPRLDVRGPSLDAAYAASDPVLGGLLVLGPCLEDADSQARLAGVTLPWPVSSGQDPTPTGFRALHVPRGGGLGFGALGLAPLPGPFWIDFTLEPLSKTSDVLRSSCCFAARANDQIADEEPVGTCLIVGALPDVWDVTGPEDFTLTFSEALPNDVYFVGLSPGGGADPIFSAPMLLAPDGLSGSFSIGPGDVPPGTYELVVGRVIASDPPVFELACGIGPATIEGAAT